MPKAFLFFFAFLLLTLPPKAAGAAGAHSQQASMQQNASVGLGAVGQTLNIPFNHPVHGEGWHDALVLLSIAPGGNAERQGLEVGDVLLAFNGTYVSKSRDIMMTLASLKEGEALSITIMRKGKVMDITFNIQAEGVAKMKKIRALMATNGAIREQENKLTAEEKAAKTINTAHSPIHFELNEQQKSEIKAASFLIKSELARGLDKADIPAIIHNLYLIRNTLKSVSSEEEGWLDQEDAAASIRFKQNNHAIVIQALDDVLFLEVYNPKGLLIYRVDSSQSARLVLCPSDIKQLLQSLGSH